MLYNRHMGQSNGFGAQIRQRRKALGLSQEVLAERIGVHWTTISRWERGQSQPIVALRKLVLTALGDDDA